MCLKLIIWPWTQSAGIPTTQKSSFPVALTGQSRSGITPSSTSCWVLAWSGRSSLTCQLQMLTLLIPQLQFPSKGVDTANCSLISVLGASDSDLYSSGMRFSIVCPRNLQSIAAQHRAWLLCFGPGFLQAGPIVAGLFFWRNTTEKCQGLACGLRGQTPPKSQREKIK